MQYSRCGLTRGEQSSTITSLGWLATLFVWSPGQSLHNSASYLNKKEKNPTKQPTKTNNHIPKPKKVAVLLIFNPHAFLRCVLAGVMCRDGFRVSVNCCNQKWLMSGQIMWITPCLSWCSIHAFWYSSSNSCTCRILALYHVLSSQPASSGPGTKDDISHVNIMFIHQAELV